MEPEGSWPYTQEPATCPYPEPDHSSLRPPWISSVSKVAPVPSTKAAIHEGEWSALRSTPEKVPFEQESGWAPEAVWIFRGKKKFCSCGDSNSAPSGAQPSPYTEYSIQVMFVNLNSANFGDAVTGCQRSFDETNFFFLNKMSGFAVETH
jgi:hypothetical protein